MCLGSLDGERVERFHDLAQNLPRRELPGRS